MTTNTVAMIPGCNSTEADGRSSKSPKSNAPSTASTSLHNQDETACKTWHFKYWCPYCERSYCCPVEKYVCAKIHTCKLTHVEHPQQHDAFRMIREPHQGSRKCFVMRYRDDGTVEDCSDSD